MRALPIEVILQILQTARLAAFREKRNTFERLFLRSRQRWLVGMTILPAFSDTDLTFRVMLRDPNLTVCLFVLDNGKHLMARHRAKRSELPEKETLYENEWRAMRNWVDFDYDGTWRETHRISAMS
jgi:hypothetical protein